jgi:hypothetical protein
VVEWRQDARREPGRTPAFDQLDHRVEVHPAIGGDRSGEIGLDTRAQEALLPPGREVGPGLGRWDAGSIV